METSLESNTESYWDDYPKYQNERSVAYYIRMVSSRYHYQDNNLEDIIVSAINDAFLDFNPTKSSIRGYVFKRINWAVQSYIRANFNTNKKAKQINLANIGRIHKDFDDIDNQDECDYLDSLYYNNKKYQMLKMQTNNNTLENISTAYNVSIERVRQNIKYIIKDIKNIGQNERDSKIKI